MYKRNFIKSVMAVKEYISSLCRVYLELPVFRPQIPLKCKVILSFTACRVVRL